MQLEGKKILFISPSFFGYECAVVKRLKELGSIVYFFDDRPSNGFWGKGLLRAHKKLYAYKIKKYYEPIEKQINEIPQIDYLFLLSPEAFPISLLRSITNRNSNVKVILYMWDSLKNKVGTQKYLSYCHSVFTFDPKDKQYAERIQFLPLFYLNEYARIMPKQTYDYEISFIGTAHSDRIVMFNKVRNQVENYGGKTYAYFYLQSKKLFIYRKLTNPYFKKTNISDFRYEPLSSKMTMDVIERSKAILDVQHPNQTGLTMRTLEILGSQRKLITTNAEVRNYDFYNPQNILVVDRDNPVIPQSFMQTPFVPIDECIYKKYSLDGWLNTIFSLS